MLFYLFELLEKMNFPGAGVFQYISFRSAATMITSLLISLVFGKQIINYLRKQQIGEDIRDLGLDGQMSKKGTPTMGGIIILASIVIPTLLFGNLKNVYVQLMLIATVWLGLIGFTDDYIKIFRKNKKGLAGKFKILGQVGLGLIVGITLYVSDDAIIREKFTEKKTIDTEQTIENGDYSNEQVVVYTKDLKSTKTTIPFFKNNEFDYAYLVSFLGDKSQKFAWIVFVIVVIIIITAVSNGANLTDGLDGLATGTSAIIGTTLGVFAYLSGNIIYADYLNIMYIPFTGELVVFMSAFIGATVGFLWYNSYPAQVFMGDTGSLTLGGIIAVFAIIIRKELLIPILCGIFLVESLSVMMQVSYFKYTRRKYGEGRRIFKMSPLHHHFQMKGYPEPKIVMRFMIVGILLAVITIVTLKIR
ncbi:MAG: phospho-N-acetylmuramoyl-pentapeptide-transferase [Bacteroidetes bacterium GWF2_33_16]|nr:MAG: phospho-N-acetylmuramoyl-pentapeptide-transferase [Bacteroidetes bacterium GWE2_32_14]OFY08565.1 MAG: phospho-N-acetylmuramoyl-pentapeptide-transferase [Bacteroidetes bacterium GWF2_33_16]